METTWKVDTMHSEVGFKVRHMMISNVSGSFGTFDANVATEGDDFTTAQFSFNADIASINTGVADRDGHLKSADFFDVEKFPTLTFKSTSVKKAKGNNYTIVGDFTMHGVTKAVTLVGTHTGSAKNRAGNDVAGLQITGVVKRSDFGVGQAGPGLSDEVNLIADLEVSKN